MRASGDGEARKRTAVGRKRGSVGQGEGERKRETERIAGGGRNQC